MYFAFINTLIFLSTKNRLSIILILKSIPQESDGGIQTLRIFLEEDESHTRILQWSVKDRKEHELWDIGQFKINTEWNHYAVMVDNSFTLKIIEEYSSGHSRQRNYFS